MQAHSKLMPVPFRVPKRGIYLRRLFAQPEWFGHNSYDLNMDTCAHLEQLLGDLGLALKHEVRAFGVQDSAILIRSLQMEQDHGVAC